MAKVNQPEVSVIILNWNGLKDTIECLESVKRITYPNYKVIIVDNGSSKNEAEVLKEKFGNWVHIIENDKNYGFCGGNNIGMRYTLNKLNPDYFLLLNNDTVVDPEIITKLVKVSEGDLTIGIAGATMYYYDKPDCLFPFLGQIGAWHGPIIKLIKSSWGKRKGQHNSVVRKVSYVPGACFLIKKKIVESIGLLDEGYFCCMDEIEYCLRTSKAGYKIVYVAEAKFWHKFKQTTGKITGFSCYYTVRNRFQLVRKYDKRWQYWWFMVYFFGLHFWLATAYYLLLHHNLKLLLSFYKGTRDGILGLRGQ